MKDKFIKPQMVRILNSLSIDTVKIPNKNYAIGKYPITIVEYMHFVRDTNSHYPEWIEDDTKYKDINLNDDAPVIGVNWHDAIAYCEWLSKKTGNTYRLPLVEDEWVYAVNQNEEGIDSFGNTVSNADDYAWFYNNSGGTTHIVGENQSYSSLGIYDMYGNVREWAEESSEDTRKAAVCGGSWSMIKYDWHFDEYEKNVKSNDLGFRVVLEIEKQEKEIIFSKQLTKTLGSNIDLVVGREIELKNIDSLLKNNNRILITGMAGIGKTTLVSMYLKKVEKNYDFLGYIRIEKDCKQSIINAFTNTLDINEDTIDNMYGMVIYKLNGLKGKKLIIIDNIVDTDDKICSEFFDTLNNSLKIILVSRNKVISDDGDIPHLELVEKHYTVCQMLGTSYFIKIILSKKDKEKMSDRYVYIDVRDYGIDTYLDYPDKKSTTSYDIERFKNILNNIEKNNWKIELNCSGIEPLKSMGYTFLTSKIFEPLQMEKENYLKFLAIKTEMEGWLLENYNYLANILQSETDDKKSYKLAEILNIAFDGKYPDEYIKRVIEELEPQYWDVESADSYNSSRKQKKLNNSKIKSNNNFTFCKIIILNMSYILKIKLIKTDKRKLLHGRCTIDIRDYYGIYNYLKLQSKKNQNNKKSKYDKLLRELELQCWRLEIQNIEGNIKNNDIEYLSNEIFRYTEQTFTMDTISSIEKDLISYIQDYDFYKQVDLGDFTKSLSKKLGIYRNTVIRILYRWKFFEKKDFSQEECTRNLKINRKILKYILTLNI